MRAAAWPLVFLLFAAGFLAALVRHDRTRVLEDAFDLPLPQVTAHVSSFENWASDTECLLAPNSRAEIVYDIPKDSDENITVEVEVLEDPALDATIVFSSKGSTRVLPLHGGVNALQSEDLPGDFGIVRIGLYATLGDAPGPVRPFERLRISVSGPRAVRWPAAAVLLLMAGAAWLLTPAVVARGLVPVKDALAGCPRWERLALAAAAAGALAFAVSSPHWFAPKAFDDVRAISNAAAMVDLGAETDRLYFRSRLRPAFAAAAMPVTMVAPYRLMHVQTAPSDFFRRVWREYDRDDDTFSNRLSAPFIVAGAAWLALWLGCLAAIGGLTGLRPAAIGAMLLAAAWCYRAMLANPVTITWNLLATAAPMVAYLLWARDRGWGGAVACGLLLALAGLTKTTAVIVAAPIGLHLLVLGISGRGGERAAIAKHALLVVACALLPVLIWYEGFLGGLLHELSGFKAEVAAVMELHPEFPRRSPALAAQMLWALGGVVWLAVLAGAALAVKQRRDAATLLMLAWLAMGVALPLTMPFLYARFFKYAIPAMAWFVAVVVQVGLCRRESTEQEEG